MSASLRALLAGAVDYAGLFPPAGLGMREAVENYARYVSGPNAWMLGRFVVPTTRLPELADAAATAAAAAGNSRGEPWRLSALVGDDVASDLEAVARFNAREDALVVDAVELKATDPERVAEIGRRVASACAGRVRSFVEIPIGGDLDALARALVAVRAALPPASRPWAKVRTGGVTPEAIPTVDELARFIRRCYASDLPFKATAGLHHPLRSVRPLTYAPDAVRAEMHGFLNVFLAAVFCHNGLGVADAPRLLALADVGELSFDDDGVRWHDYRVSTSEIERIRRRFVASFGSCSFTEPIDDLRELELL